MNDSRVMVLVQSGSHGRVIATGTNARDPVWIAQKEDELSTPVVRVSLPEATHERPGGQHVASTAVSPDSDESLLVSLMCLVIMFLAVIGAVYLARWVAGTLPDALPAIVRWPLGVLAGLLALHCGWEWITRQARGA